MLTLLNKRGQSFYYAHVEGLERFRPKYDLSNIFDGLEDKIKEVFYKKPEIWKGIHEQLDK